MTATQLSLILLSACIHVVAHVALRRTADRLAFAWWLLVLTTVVFLPIACWRGVGERVPWLLLLASAACEAGYFAALARAYRDGELSLVYPLARGTAPVFLVAWSAVGGEPLPTLGGLGGIAVIVLGLWIINLPSLREWSAPLRAIAHVPAARWAVAAGLCTSGYTLLDRHGVQQVDPWTWNWLVLAATAAWLTPQVWWRCGPTRLRAEWVAARGSIALAAGTGFLAYALVLIVLRDGASAAIVGAAREVSVVFSVVVGITVLRERVSWLRIVGALTVALGVGVLRFSG
ncbi:MAG: EamA family transporter [Planctomycetes bacterium]|nr:EamA family transporter [Planctomycetota bacterium]